MSARRGTKWTEIRMGSGAAIGMRVARVIPNHALTSLGREKEASEMASKRMGSVGLSKSSMARMG